MYTVRGNTLISISGENASLKENKHSAFAFAHCSESSEREIP